MVEGVHHNQPCSRPGDDVDRQMMMMMMGGSSQSSKFARRQVNCAIVVANMAEIYAALKDGDSKPLHATKQVFCVPALKKGSKFLFYLLLIELL